jgi:hypothetical protein
MGSAPVAGPCYPCIDVHSGCIDRLGPSTPTPMATNTETYPRPGRGAWTLTGGLLPAKAGSTARRGYYRLSVDTERPIGSTFATGADTSHHARVVNYGVRAIQMLLGIEADGWFGPVTDQGVRTAQRNYGLEVDGIVGVDTMRELLRPVLANIGDVTGVAVPILGGLITNESGLDPAAVGVNGQDHGLAQINLGAHKDVSVLEALTPDYAIHWSAEDLAHVHDTWARRTTVDPWKIAIASHNSPLLAKRWAVTGKAPVVDGRLFQIEEYVDKVLTSWPA